MARAYRVTYKAYLNDRLNQIDFHGKHTHPLYIQVTFDRKTIFFKSYYFELFSKPRYLLHAVGKKKGPSVVEIISKENELLDFIIDKIIYDFSLDRFKEMYKYYSRDLCDLMEDGFRQYLFTFFHDKGMPALAKIILDGSKNKLLYDIIQDLKLALKPVLHQELIENSFHYGPPYLPLYGFMIQQKRPPMLTFNVMEWTDLKVNSEFKTYIAKRYPDKDTSDLVGQIETCLKLT